MVEMPGLYFVIANDVQARFVRPGPDHRPHTVRAVNAITLLDHGDDASIGNGAVRFARSLAQSINDDFAVGLFSHLVLVAPPHVLRELTATVEAAIGESLIGSVAADLVAVPDHELSPHLRAWLPPVATR